MTERIAGLRGRLPVKPEGERFALSWAHELLVQAVPLPVYPIDVTGGITDFGMLGNDQYGDCGEAGIRHVEMTTAVMAGFPVPTFTTPEAVSEYMAFTGGQDTGVNLADFLLWLYKAGRIKAFAPVDHTNVSQTNSLLAEFHGLYCGVNLTDDANALFNAGQPWTVSGGEQSDPREGHCIEKVKAMDPNLYGAMDGWITWGADQPSTVQWSAACLDEVWLVVTTEEQLAKFTPALLSEINALSGTGGTP